VVHSFDTNTFFGFPTTDTITFSTDASERIRITSSGNVGIGTTSPSDFDSVGADNLVVGPGTGNNGITVYSATTGYGALAFADGNTSASVDQYRGLIQYNHTSDTLALFTNATTKMTILSGGNVGIGVTGPATKLDVVGADNGDTMRVANTGTYGGTISFNQGTANTSIGYVGSLRAFEGAVSGDNGIGLFSRDRISFYTNSSNPDVTITSSGDIRQYAATGGGYSQTKILPKVTPNYPGSGQSGTLENWYQPTRGESGIIHYGSVNLAGGAYRCAGFIVFSAADSNTTPVAITIVATESVGANMVAFGTASGWIQIQNTYGYGIKIMGRVESFIN
jgi:hypothetical protein